MLSTACAVSLDRNLYISMLLINSLLESHSTEPLNTTSAITRRYQLIHKLFGDAINSVITSVLHVILVLILVLMIILSCLAILKCLVNLLLHFS